MSSWVREMPKKQGVKKPEVFSPMTDTVLSPQQSAIPNVKQFAPPAQLTAPGVRRIDPIRRNQNTIIQPQAQPQVQVSPQQPRPLPQAPEARQVQVSTRNQSKQPVAKQTKTQAKKKEEPVKEVEQSPAPENPQITVVIPLFNGVDFLSEALASVKKQTYTDWVGIIGINGHGFTGEPVLSKTNSIIQSLGMSNQFIAVNLPNVKGAAQAISQVVQVFVKTPYVAHIDCDDMWLPKKLELQMKVIEKNPNVGIVGTHCRYFGESTAIPKIPDNELYRGDFVKMNPLIHSSVLIRTELAIYTDEFVTYDYDCWVRNLLNGVRLWNVPLLLVLHRIHKTSFYNASNKQEPDLVRQKYKLLT
jgi:hypothetical protein